MLNNITIGRYIPANSIIHHLDPRSKILAVIVFIVTIFISKSIPVYLGITALLIFVLTLSKIPLKVYFNSVKALKILILFMAVFNLIFIKTGYVVVDLGFFKIYSEALTQTFFIIMRILLLVIYTSLLTLTTSPMELTDGIESLLKPFNKIGISGHDAAMMISIALRFIPTLLDETERIMKAQTSRGVDFVDSKLKEKVMAIVSLLVPLFISAFVRAEELANAMEARGYRGGVGRTKFRVLKWKMKDTIALSLHFLLLLFILII